MSKKYKKYQEMNFKELQDTLHYTKQHYQKNGWDIEKNPTYQEMNNYFYENFTQLLDEYAKERIEKR
jgi:hypothetical protein